VLLLLEDLHWADEGTLSLFNHLARAVAKLPVMVVGTYRDNELDPGGLLTKTLDELIRLRLVERISLRGLPQNAVTEMLRALSGREPSEALVASFYPFQHRR
jgi:predicted ATPase